MRRLLLLLGSLLACAGVVFLGADLVAGQHGLTPSINLGDPVKFEFFLVPFWVIGMVCGGLGFSVLFFARYRAHIRAS